MKTTRRGFFGFLASVPVVGVALSREAEWADEITPPIADDNASNADMVDTYVSDFGATAIPHEWQSAVLKVSQS